MSIRLSKAGIMPKELNKDHGSAAVQ